MSIFTFSFFHKKAGQARAVQSFQLLAKRRSALHRIFRLQLAQLGTLSGILHGPAHLGELCADGVGGSPVLGLLGGGTLLHQFGHLSGNFVLLAVIHQAQHAGDLVEGGSAGFESSLTGSGGQGVDVLHEVEDSSQGIGGVQIVVHGGAEFLLCFLGLLLQRLVGAELGLAQGKVEVLAAGVETLEAVLAALSNQTCDHLDELTLDLELIGELDFIFAKATLSRHYRGCEPRLNKDGIIRLKNARHPLLDPHRVVPITLTLGENFDLLIVTGPNTGGKTVSLKTVGLLTLMGLAGLHVPAAEGTTLSVFTEVYADIGDEQSIEQNLSTFSSHMTNTVKFLDKADKDSLVLFDELGAGTDPVEGAALAMAILSFLHNMKVRTMATTHYSELKLFALSTPGVENASCEFNVETLRPTYRLLVGIPGKSNAFAISRKLGLPEFIIDDAKKHIDSQDESFEDVISNLEASRVQMEQDKEQIAAYKEEMESLKKQLSAQKEKLEQQKAKILQDANEKARKVLQDAKDYADETIRIINKKTDGGEVSRLLEEERTKLRTKLDKTASKAQISQPKASPSKKPDAKKLKLGDAVKVVSLNLRGIVSSLPNARGDLFVQMGILRSQVNINDLELIDEQTISGDGVPAMRTKQKGNGSGKIRMSKSASVSPEINLIGKTVDEAIPELDKYLDDAYLAHLEKVRVVHGRGTGALRNGVHQHLRKLKYVKSFHLGEFGEGDSGVTIVTFK